MALGGGDGGGEWGGVWGGLGGLGLGVVVVMVVGGGHGCRCLAGRALTRQPGPGARPVAHPWKCTMRADLRRPWYILELKS